MATETMATAKALSVAPFEFRVVHSDRKTIRITVERDRSVVVRAPHRATPEQIVRAVSKHKRWILGKIKHPQKYQKEHSEARDSPGSGLVSGTTVYYLGRSYRVDVLRNHRDHERDYEEARASWKGASKPCGVELRGDHLAVYVPGGSDAGSAVDAWLKASAQKQIVPIASEVAERLGVTYTRILISDLRCRWGSCTPKGALNFNWRLVKAPLSVIRYVVAHELAHLIEPNHTDRFWRIVKVQAPRYERARQWLRENGALLEA